MLLDCLFCFIVGNDIMITTSDKTENDPKAMAKKQKSGAMALVGVTNSAQRKLVKMEEKHAERFELLEKERQGMACLYNNTCAVSVCCFLQCPFRCCPISSQQGSTMRLRIPNQFAPFLRLFRGKFDWVSSNAS
eukprot:COSAG06_NODE_167_length_21546_cov_35.001352_32_plen_134_part_00